ncbi:MAG: hypothetical protein ACTTJ6_06485 [Treponema sp.]
MVLKKNYCDVGNFSLSISQYTKEPPLFQSTRRGILLLIYYVEY